MTAETIRFDQLKKLSTNGLRFETSKHRGVYSLEFFDNSGKRYQKDGIDSTSIYLITSALSSGKPAYIWYGKWDTPISTDKIFTIYQLEIGQEIFISYDSYVTLHEKEKSGAPVIMLFTILFFGIIIFIVVKRHKKYADSLKSPA